MISLIAPRVCPPAMSSFPVRLRTARHAEDLYGAFAEIFDVNASCAQNLRVAVLAILEANTLTMEDVVRLHLEPACAGIPNSLLYAHCFLRLAMLNALRCEEASTVEEIGASIVVGRESLEEMRAFCDDLMAPTYEVQAAARNGSRNTTSVRAKTCR